MKKLLKVGLIMLVISALSFGFVLQCIAESIYIVNGYSYTYLDNESVSLCGWDGRTTELIVPDSIAGKYVTEISARGYQNSENFSEIDFSQADHLKTIRTYAFENCSGLTGELRLEGSFSSVEDCAFQSCKSIDSLYVGKNISIISNQCFSDCDSLTNVVLAEGIQKINAFAFSSCESLNNVVIPVSVTSISKYAFSGSGNIVINCNYDSYAHQYAVNNNIPYTLLDGVKLGDADGDGSVNVSDVTLIQRYLAELDTLEGIYLHAADANQDGTVDISDATALQMYIAEYDLPYPIGEVMTQ